MNSYSRLFYTICYLLLLTSCTDATHDMGIRWTDESHTYVRKGIDAPHKMSEVSLEFIALSSDLHAESDEPWIISEILTLDNSHLLKITVTDNPSASPREGVVKLIAGRDIAKITVRQAGFPSVVNEKNVYYIASDGGEVTIKVAATGKMQSSLFPKDCNWAKITRVTSGEKNGEYLISVSIGKNSGFGRLVGLELFVDGVVPIQGLGPSIIQEPAPFDTEVALKAEKPGSLPVLLGNNINNLSRIRKLSIEGAINGLDFEVFKKILSIKDDEGNLQPISFDLSKCDIGAGNDSPYQLFGYKTEFNEFPDVFLEGEIPMGVFTGATNLQSIILPTHLKYIGRKAFMGCTSLQTIVIPDVVEEIFTKAFFGCSNLKDIKFSSKSNLLALGKQVFTTGSILNDLYLPYTLTNLNIETFLGCSTTGLHLRWLEPFEVKVVPNIDGCTLYVPKNTKELYRQSPSWGKFENIVEE